MFLLYPYLIKQWFGVWRGVGSRAGADQNGFVSAKMAQGTAKRQGEADHRGENESEKEPRCQSRFVAEGANWK